MFSPFDTSKSLSNDVDQPRQEPNLQVHRCVRDVDGSQRSDHWLENQSLEVVAQRDALRDIGDNVRKQNPAQAIPGPTISMLENTRSEVRDLSRQRRERGVLLESPRRRRVRSNNENIPPSTSHSTSMSIATSATGPRGPLSTTTNYNVFINSTAADFMNGRIPHERTRRNHANTYSGRNIRSTLSSPPPSQPVLQGSRPAAHPSIRFLPPVAPTSHPSVPGSTSMTSTTDAGLSERLHGASSRNRSAEQSQSDGPVISRGRSRRSASSVAAQIEDDQVDFAQVRRRELLGQMRNLPFHEVPVARRPYREPEARHDLGRMDIECPHCGALHWSGEQLSKSTRSSPVFGICCDGGQVRLGPLDVPPYPLRRLFVSNDAQAREFRENIRQYNAALAFTSLGVKIDESVNRGRGPYVFRIQGELCHRAGSLIPPEGRQPSYAQLYIYDPQAALDQRMQRNSNLREDTMKLLQNLIAENHWYADRYKHAFEIIEEHGEDDISIRLHFDSSQDRRRYNLPTADEVAAIIPGDGEQERDSRDIVLHKRSGRLERMSDMHPAYACLHYVLLFPKGDHGWHWDLRMYQPERRHQRRLTQTRWLAYHLQVRKDEFMTILRGGRLFQQYIVDMWACADQNRLNWYKLNQQHCRASLYSGLEDAVAAADDDVDLNQLGQRVILPSSYQGGPRHMQQQFQDALAIGRRFKKIDVFMTVTCNPEWPEITRELLPGQKPSDRPDLIARVFQLKKQAILDDIFKHGVLGRTVACVYTIEFQKRGLPHMHLLIFFDDGYKLLTPEDIDSLIWAMWPDPETEPLLFEAITSPEVTKDESYADEILQRSNVALTVGTTFFEVV